MCNRGGPINTHIEVFARLRRIEEVPRGGNAAPLAPVTMWIDDKSVLRIKNAF